MTEVLAPAPEVPPVGEAPEQTEAAYMASINEWPVITDAWADTYCELTGRSPDGKQVTFVDGGVVTTFREVAKREIDAMLCAASKGTVRDIIAYRLSRQSDPAGDDGSISAQEAEIPTEQIDKPADQVALSVYESAVKGRQDFRQAYRSEREKTAVLTDALQAFVKQWNACGPNSDFGRNFKPVRDQAVAAIAKATGAA